MPKTYHAKRFTYVPNNLKTIKWWTQRRKRNQQWFTKPKERLESIIKTIKQSTFINDERNYCLDYASEARNGGDFHLKDK